MKGDGAICYTFPDEMVSDINVLCVVMVLEIGPKGRANGRDSRLLRLKFDTNKCKYNVLSLGFQHTLSSKEAKEKNKIK